MEATTSECSDSESNKKVEYSENISNEETYKIKLKWSLVIIIGFLEIGSIYGLYLVFVSAKLATTVFALFLHQIAIWGITAGAHRLWSHRAYKAKLPLRLMLMIMTSIAYQYSVINWARDHRVHHKFGDTNADPYNPKRGFFFSHIGWILCEKHPDVTKKGRTLDFSDLFDDPILKFQYDHFTLISLLFATILPVTIPIYFWNETIVNSFFVAVALRWTIGVNSAGLINSAAHMWGMKPYDKNLSAAENMFTTFSSFGEAWHNYHHAFPWDYRAMEMRNHWMNSTASFIDFFALIGWAYDLKTTSPDIIKKRVERTGDGSYCNIIEDDQTAAIAFTQKHF